MVLEKGGVKIWAEKVKRVEWSSPKQNLNFICIGLIKFRRWLSLCDIFVPQHPILTSSLMVGKLMSVDPTHVAK